MRLWPFAFCLLGLVALLPSTAVAVGTVTTVTSSANPSVSGQSVTFTATVTPFFPGTVTFVVDGVSSSPVNSVQTGGSGIGSGVGQATFTTAALSIAGSPHTVTANFAETLSLGNDTSSGSLSGGQTVGMASTTTAVTSSVNPSVSGQSVTFTATVSAQAPGSGTPTGTVTFQVDSVTVGTPQTLNGSGQATLTAAIGSVANSPHTITATYNADPNFSGSTGSLSGGQTITKASTTTTVTLSSLTFTATVSARAPGSGTPTGTVTFQVDGTTVGAPQTLNGSGQASLTVGAGLVANPPHTITATYGGDPNFNGSAGSSAISGSVPTLSTWALVFLGMLLTALAMRVLRPVRG